MELKNRVIAPTKTIIEAFKLMDWLDKKLLLVLDSGIFCGLISVGDLQRAIIQNKPLDTQISTILRKNIKVAKPEDSFESIRNMMFDYRMELCPVINHDNEIIEIYFWEDVFHDKTAAPFGKFNLDVVIMAGGFGTRLSPLTNVLPKPLIPIGTKTILEHIFEKFEYYGSQKFYISVNYKADLIEYYLSRQNLPYNFEFFKEEKPLGTAGSLSLLKNKVLKTFFVSNCDILIEQDYSEILDFHNVNENELTIVSAMKHYDIPYGTIESGENGQLLVLKEKPSLTFKINTGMYILEPSLLDEIPENDFFHITCLIEKIRRRGGRVGVFPVSERSWKDVGDWQEYLKHILV